MLLRMESGLGEHHSGELRREVADAKAERIVAEELKRRGWQEKDLLTRPRSDKAGVGVAAASGDHADGESDCRAGAFGNLKSGQRQAAQLHAPKR